jgi:prepilin-type N-terminal cleavage/methylation domain-containing protein
MDAVLCNAFSARARARIRGVTLLEMLVVVGVISVLVTIATYGYTTYMAAKGAQEARLMDTAANCMRALYARDQSFLGQNGGGEATTAVAANNNCFPKVLVTAGFGTANPTLKNAYGGDIVVQALASNATRLTITSTNLPAAICRSLGAALIGAVIIDVERTSDEEVTRVRKEQTGLDLEDLGTACGTGNEISSLTAIYTR